MDGPEVLEERWERGEIGFHEGRPNQLLEKHIGLFEGRRRVLVPLSGKAVDLRFLAERGLEVVGVELVEAAARAFFEEQALEMSERREGDFLVLESG
ncbi:MAG: thiopurine S-methyltransferase, partial [Sandaracinaceae bacterium]|nr:thiopurine S-methyltransferase [Sandaracinaceae bacterium]